MCNCDTGINEKNMKLFAKRVAVTAQKRYDRYQRQVCERLHQYQLIRGAITYYGLEDLYDLLIGKYRQATVTDPSKVECVAAENLLGLQPTGARYNVFPTTDDQERGAQQWVYTDTTRCALTGHRMPQNRDRFYCAILHFHSYRE